MVQREEEPRQGEHWNKSVWIVLNPAWPSGYDPYLVLCPGCEHCERDDG